MHMEVAPPRLTGHQPGLDGVRGLAIIMVMAIHFVGDATAQTFAQTVIVKAASFGLLGVDLFFVLSGFLITGLLLDAKSGSHYFRNFYARRTLRIFPLYYGVLAALFLLLPLATPLTPMLEQAREHQAWLWTYTSNFYVASESSWSSLSYVTHFWSLAIEEHFYLLWPLVVFTVRRETLERICLGVIAAGLALRIGLALAGVSELAISVLTPCRIDTLCVGGFLAAVARREGGLQMLLGRCGKAVLGIGVAVLLLSAYCALAKTGLPVLHQIRNTLYALFFGALTLLSLRPTAELISRSLRSPLLGFFGKYSYGLYVYHGLLAWYLYESGAEARLDALLDNHWLTIGAKAAIGVSISIVVAVLSYELFEKRFLALKRFFEATPARPAARASAPARGASEHAANSG
jgi:peptidoglycan/LPS O-acetylase OafA/YrhL